MSDFKLGIKNTITANVGDNVCELYFLDAIANPTYYDWSSGEEVEGNLLAQIIDQVKYSQASKIICYIDSLGGSFRTGMAIYNYLKNCSAKVECKILGMCGSIATIIACAANKGKISMPESGLYIIHEASENPNGPLRASDLVALAASTEKCTDVMCEVYNQTTGISAEELKSMIAPGDYWMTGKEALAKGFVNSLYNNADVTVTACIESAKTANLKIPENILALTETPTEQVDTTFFKTQFMELKSFVTAAIEAIKGKKVDAKAENITAQIGEAIAEPLATMVSGIEEQVTAEIAKVTETVTADVTASLKETYDAKIQAVETENTALKTSITNITAELTKAAGKQSPAMGVDTNATANKTPSLAGAGRKASEIAANA